VRRGLLFGEGLMLYMILSEVVRLRGEPAWKATLFLLVCAVLNGLHEMCIASRSAASGQRVD
jgi:hypothetical protein